LKGISGKQLCRILEAKDWELKRIHGSHHIFMRSGSNVRISIPVHGSKTLKLGLQKHIMKIAEIDESEL